MGEVVNGVLLLVGGLVLWLLTRGRLEAIERRLDRLEDSFSSRLDRLEDSVTAQIDRLRSDVTQIALAFGGQPPAEAGK